MIRKTTSARVSCANGENTVEREVININLFFLNNFLFLFRNTEFFSLLNVIEIASVAHLLSVIRQARITSRCLPRNDVIANLTKEDEAIYLTNNN